MKRKLTAVLLIALGAAVGQPVSAQSKADAPKSASLDQLDCRTLLKLDGDERAYALVYYHGFISGRSNQLSLPTDVMATATDKIIDHCIDKPGDKVLAVFEQVRKQAK